MNDEAPRLAKEIEAAKLLKLTLRDVRQDGDLALLSDMIEGETSLFEAIDNALLDLASTNALIEAIDSLINTVGKRRDRLENRADLTKAAIQTAMGVAEVRSLKRPLATISLGRKAPSLVVTNEANIPPDYWKPQPPKLDKKALGDALKAGATVPGAELSNGGETISVRPL